MTDDFRNLMQIMNDDQLLFRPLCRIPTPIDRIPSSFVGATLKKEKCFRTGFFFKFWCSLVFNFNSFIENILSRSYIRQLYWTLRLYVDVRISFSEISWRTTVVWSFFKKSCWCRPAIVLQKQSFTRVL